jgi:hypothetical protein
MHGWKFSGLLATSAIAVACALSAVGQTLTEQTPALATTQDAPPASGAIFPLSQVHAGLRATAWTVFRGNKPEPMDVEILGVLRGGRGPGQDMILAQLHGAKPEYTGVVAGMSGSPVYVDGKLMGALAYRIGQFSKDPIAGITPIEQMLAVRDLPVSQDTASLHQTSTGNMNLQPMETPLAMSGFGPEAIRFWQKQMAGTGMETVAAGSMGGSSETANDSAAASTVVPGSAVSALLIRGDMEIAATCTVTYADTHQLLACGHPLLQAGTVSLPMTSTEVVATLASPLNAFKIVNTGQVIGAFTEDRDAAIRGELGRTAHMIPMSVTLHTKEAAMRQVKVEILDQSALTPQAAMVVLLQSLVSALSNTAEASYHLRGTISVEGMEPFPLDEWATPSEQMSAPVSAVIQLGEQLRNIYTNSTRRSSLQRIELDIEALPRRAQIELTEAHLVGSSQLHAGDWVEVEATLRPWQQPDRQVRLGFRLPARLAPGPVRLLVSSAGTLDRVMDPPQLPGHVDDLKTLLASSRERHAADRIYASLLEVQAQLSSSGQTLSSLPLSIANTLEPHRSTQEAILNGESVEVMTESQAGDPVNGFALLSLHIMPGAGLD